MPPRALVVDDDDQIRRALRTSLRAQGYEVVEAIDGTSALTAAVTADPDLVVLDLGLPDIDGIEVIRRLRAHSQVPVIVLSVRDSQDQKVAAFDLGADDYVTKPFGIDELLARMRAVTRRTRGDDGESVLRFGDLEIDLARDLVSVRDEQLRMTPTEYKLLLAMASNPGKLLTHRWLLQRVWGPGYASESQYLRVFVRQLRRKLRDDAARPRFILTEPGLGYRWKASPDVDRSASR
jgi:two-component system, OmpR family, KDP operon response regulator KdpE